MRELFIDTNILFDVLVDRGENGEFSEYARELFDYAGKHSIRLNVCPLSYSNLYYSLRKIPFSHEDIIIDLWKISKRTRCLLVNEEIIEQALKSNFRDFEDAIQNFCASQLPKCEAIITRDRRGFRASTLPVMAPERFLIEENFKKI